MFSSGHVEILTEVFREYFQDQYFKNIPYKEVTLKNFLIGLGIVDFPCASYNFNENGRVKITSYKLCKLARIFDSFFSTSNKVESANIFQYHKGYFAHLHAMTTDPENNILKIRNKIIMSIMGYCLLSVFDMTIFDDQPTFSPNIFWIGMICHIITDSYSPSHTIREKKYKAVKIPIQKEKSAILANRLKIREYVKDLAKNSSITTLEDFQKQFDGKLNDINIYWKSYKMFRFEYDTNKLVRKWVPLKKLECKTGFRGIEKYGDIMTFQHSSSQFMLKHLASDFLYVIKKKKVLYRRMKNECALFMQIYLDVLKTRNIKKFLIDVYDLMMNETFRIHEKYLTNSTDLLIR